MGHLGVKGEPLILVVSDKNEVVGIAPLARRDGEAFFLGTADVCDYQDAVIAPGHEESVTHRLLDHLAQIGVSRLDLQTLRPDAAVARALDAIQGPAGLRITRQPVEVTYETALPETWDGYLMQLNGKQRHEVRRKVRRLESHGAYGYRMAGFGKELGGATEQFLRLFHLNRQDKAEFMDSAMSAYFRGLIERLARQKMLRLCFLDVDDRPVAAVLCFDYNRTRYLYNSGYDAAYHHLSVGILSKVFSIQKGLEEGCRKYDFLKGAEVYKRRIGGQEVPLYRYVVTF